MIITYLSLERFLFVLWTPTLFFFYFVSFSFLLSSLTVVDQTAVYLIIVPLIHLNIVPLL